MAKEHMFHPNPQVRRSREMDPGQHEGADNKGEGEGKPGEPATMVETHRHEDGSYHTVTHHADGSVDHQEHGSHEEAKDHERQMFHEGGEEGKDDEQGEACPDCDGSGCETCGGSGQMKSEGEEY